MHQSHPCRRRRDEHLGKALRRQGDSPGDGRRALFEMQAGTQLPQTNQGKPRVALLRTADLLLLSGIMSNISAPDIERLVRVSQQFCAAGATVIWTRGAQDPDLRPDIRRWFDEAGFEELSRGMDRSTGMRVGVNRLITPPSRCAPAR